MVHIETIEQLSIPAFICNEKGEFLLVNEKLAEFLEIDKNTLLNSNFVLLNTPRNRHQVFKALKSALNCGQKELEIELKTGTSTKQVTLHLSAIGENLLIGLLCDISQFRQTEKRLLSTIIKAEEKERRRIATALHDDLSPILSAIKLYVDLLRDKIKPEAQPMINNIEQLIDLAIKTAKEISYNITPNILHDFGLAEAIRKFADFVNVTNSLKIKINTKKYTLNKRLVIEAILYQAAKELINNTIKHSQATEAMLELSNTDTMIVLYYRDNGKGFDPAVVTQNGTGLGLRNLMHKVRSFGGQVQFHSEPGQGMIALVTIPIPEETESIEYNNIKTQNISTNEPD